MKFFGKSVTKAEKKELVSQLLAVVLAGAFVVVLGALSFAWFSMNPSIRQTGMEIVASSQTVDLLVERTTVYDTGYDGIVGANGLKAALTANGYSLTETDTDDAPFLADELENEYVFETKRYMMPGAYGKMTFYIRPKAGNDGKTVRFSLKLTGYVDGYDGETPVVAEATSERVKQLLKGHVLFFTGRTGATYEDFCYSGLIDGGFSYNMSEHTKCEEVGKTDCYKVVLYWEWPVTYYDIVDYLSTTSPAVTRKYPAEVGTYISSHEEYFFPISVYGATDEARSDAYNDGDQTIGDGVDYFVAVLTVV